MHLYPLAKNVMSRAGPTECNQKLIDIASLSRDRELIDMQTRKSLSLSEMGKWGLEVGGICSVGPLSTRGKSLLQLWVTTFLPD